MVEEQQQSEFNMALAILQRIDKIFNQIVETRTNKENYGRKGWSVRIFNLLRELKQQIAYDLNEKELNMIIPLFKEGRELVSIYQDSKKGEDYINLVDNFESIETGLRGMLDKRKMLIKNKKDLTKSIVEM